MSGPDARPRQDESSDDVAWAATRAVSPPTQLLRDDERDAAGPNRDVGRDVGNGQRELFVTCAPAEALLQQFEVLRPEFIAIHDLGCAISRRLLAGVAQASGRPLQTLTIRRQGYGTALATLEFIEWSSPGCRTIRLYTTTVDADGVSRHAIAQTLLGHSRLAVVIVGDLPGHAIGSGLQPMHKSMRFQPWPNRELMLLPLSSASVLAAQAGVLTQGTPVNVRTTPQVVRPADAWSYLSGAWNRLREQPGLETLQLPTLPSVNQSGSTAKAAGDAAPAPAAGQAASPAPTTSAPGADPSTAAAATPTAASPLPMRPMPAVPRDGPRTLTLEETLQDYVARLLKLNGMVDACVFDRGDARALAHAGRVFAPAALAARGHALMQGCLDAGRALAMPLTGPEAAITLGAHHLVLHPLPRHPELMLLAVLDKNAANLTLARLQIQRLDEDFST